MIGPGRPGVVVGVALEVEQEPVGEAKGAVPAVVGLHALVLAAVLLAHEAVVLNVVDGLEQEYGDQRLSGKEQHAWAPGEQEHAAVDSGQAQL